MLRREEGSSRRQLAECSLGKGKPGADQGSHHSSEEGLHSHVVAAHSHKEVRSLGVDVHSLLQGHQWMGHLGHLEHPQRREVEPALLLAHVQELWQLGEQHIQKVHEWPRVQLAEGPRMQILLQLQRHSRLPWDWLLPARADRCGEGRPAGQCHRLGLQRQHCWGLRRYSLEVEVRKAIAAEAPPPEEVQRAAPEGRPWEGAVRSLVGHEVAGTQKVGGHDREAPARTQVLVHILEGVGRTLEVWGHIPEEVRHIHRVVHHIQGEPRSQEGAARTLVPEDN